MFLNTDPAEPLHRHRQQRQNTVSHDPADEVIDSEVGDESLSHAPLEARGDVHPTWNAMLLPAPVSTVLSCSCVRSMAIASVVDGLIAKTPKSIISSWSCTASQLYTVINHYTTRQSDGLYRVMYLQYDIARPRSSDSATWLGDVQSFVSVYGTGHLRLPG